MQKYGERHLITPANNYKNIALVNFKINFKSLELFIFLDINYFIRTLFKMGILSY